MQNQERMVQMAKYKKRADGRYYTLVSTKKLDEKGKPIRIPVYAKTSKELEEKVAELKTDIKRGTYANDEGKTLGEYAMQWYTSSKEGTVAPATARDYLNVIKNHFDLISDIKLRDLTKTHVLSQINKPGNSKETRRRITLTIKQVLESAIDDGLLYRNVARSIKSPSVKAAEKRALTDAEKEAIKRCDFSPMEKMYVDILYCTGMRRSELLALQKKDINLYQSTITINKAITFVGGSQIKDTKSESGSRTLPVPFWLVEELRVYISSLESEFLFHGQNNAMISESTAKRMWQSIFNKINVAMGGTQDNYRSGKLIDKGMHMTDLTPHIFRHNYATMLYNSGVDVKEAQRLMGHSSIKITLEIYTHLAESNNLTAEKINRITL